MSKILFLLIHSFYKKAKRFLKKANVFIFLKKTLIIYINLSKVPNKGFWKSGI